MEFKTAQQNKKFEKKIHSFFKASLSATKSLSIFSSVLPIYEHKIHAKNNLNKTNKWFKKYQGFKYLSKFNIGIFELNCYLMTLIKLIQREILHAGLKGFQGLLLFIKFYLNT